MCNHHFALSWLPTNDQRQLDYSGSKRITALHLGDWRAGRSDPGEEQLKQQIIDLAKTYALAYPQRASELHLQRCDCNGPWDDGEYVFANQVLPVPTLSETVLAKDIIRLREALELYDGCQAKDNSSGRYRSVSVRIPADEKTAYKALWPGDEHEPK